MRSLHSNTILQLFSAGLENVCGGAGKRLYSPQDERTRPMMEKVRGALFSMLAAQLGGAGALPTGSRWLDVCAGTVCSVHSPQTAFVTIASFLAELSVSSPQKLFIFIIVGPDRMPDRTCTRTF